MPTRLELAEKRAAEAEAKAEARRKEVRNAATAEARTDAAAYLKARYALRTLAKVVPNGDAWALANEILGRLEGGAELFGIER